MSRDGKKKAPPSPPKSPGEQWREELLQYRPRGPLPPPPCDDAEPAQTLHEYDPLEAGIQEFDTD